MLNHDCLEHRLFRSVEERSQARGRDLCRPMSAVYAVEEDLLTTADGLAVALGKASGTRPR